MRTTQTPADSIRTDTAAKVTVVRPLPRIAVKKPEPIKPVLKSYSKKSFDSNVELFKQFNCKQPQKKQVILCDTASAKAVAGISLSQTGYRNNHFYSFTFFFLIALVAFLAFLRFRFSKYLLQVIGSVANNQVSGRLYRDRSALFEKVDLQLNVLFILVCSLFLAYTRKYLNIELPVNDFIVWLVCLAIMITFVSYHFISSIVMGWIMDRYSDFHEYMHTTFIYFKVLGLILIPVTVFMVYLPEHFRQYPLYAGIIALCIMFIIRILRCFVLLMKKGILLFYTILYLCTIEFLPLLLVGKFAITYYR